MSVRSNQTNKPKPNRENAMLWGPSPKRVIREFEAWLAALGRPVKMSPKSTGEHFVRFCAAREHARDIRRMAGKQGPQRRMGSLLPKRDRTMSR
jgi:hypothetical protein